MACCLALVTLVGCGDTQADEDLKTSDPEDAEEAPELGFVQSKLEKVVYRSINAGDPPAVYYGAGNIEVKLSHSSLRGAALEVTNKSGTPITLPYAKITVKCQDGSGDWTNESNPGQLDGGKYWGHVQLCISKLVSASIEVKIVRP
jgi:hypothetical protein